ncbi:hypothetical protein ONA70_14200, partial [Micromonospora yasonensis]|uniref:hypothetical protein n=1 Tax=Micromonospora yasonensis TaxID=1128667 RepID=UPI00222FFEBC
MRQQHQRRARLEHRRPGDRPPHAEAGAGPTGHRRAEQVAQVGAGDQQADRGGGQPQLADRVHQQHGQEAGVPEVGQAGAEGQRPHDRVTEHEADPADGVPPDPGPALARRRG